MSERVTHVPQEELQNAIQNVSGGDCAAALSVLCAAAKKQAERDLINTALKDRTPVYKALISDAPKARKNAARLLGALREPADVPPLIAALERESTRFVRPSIILALGALGTDAARAALLSLPEPQAATTDEEKHAADERDAIRTALAKLSPIARHRVRDFTAPRRMELRAPAGFLPQLATELKSLSIPPLAEADNRVTVAAPSLKQIYRARCFTEALFPLAQHVTNTPEAAAAAAAAPLAALLQEVLEGEPPYAYRLELRFPCDRAAYARAFQAALPGDLFSNNPSQYELELRVEPALDTTVNLYAKLTAYRDPRFLYRREAISASIHPATAAALVRFAADFFTAPAPRVLDPFCGAGTLLLEWEKQQPFSALLGIELSATTAALAKRNISGCKSHVKVIQKDCTAFVPDAPYDLILSNLPFGNRVGTHKDNERLYADFVSNLPRWLSPGGTAVLYTMEYTLLSRCIKKTPGLRLMKETRTEAGGLLPWVLVVGRI
ncbi:MAG: methyltransferase [Eubacteriales bacterium]|nr:methyltransferase [Eubacteriales bacterium]